VNAVGADERDPLAIRRERRLGSIRYDSSDCAVGFKRDNFWRAGRIAVSVIRLTLRHKSFARSAVRPRVVVAVVRRHRPRAGEERGCRGGEANVDGPRQAAAWLLGEEDHHAVAGPGWVLALYAGSSVNHLGRCAAVVADAEQGTWLVSTGGVGAEEDSP